MRKPSPEAQNRQLRSDIKRLRYEVSLLIEDNRRLWQRCSDLQLDKALLKNAVEALRTALEKK